MEVQARDGGNGRSQEENGESGAHEDRMAERVELELALRTSEENAAVMQGEIDQLRRELRLQGECTVAGREAMLQQTELERLHAVEDRRKWEERESGWCEKITSIEEALRSPGSPEDKVSELERQLEMLTRKLHSTEAVLSGMSEVNEQLKRENHTLLEQNTELERQRLSSDAANRQGQLGGLGMSSISLSDGVSLMRPLGTTGVRPLATTAVIPPPHLCQYGSLFVRWWA